MTASSPPATVHDGWAGEREHDHGEPGCICNTNCEWRDGGGRKNKRWIKGGGERGGGLGPPLALLLFLPFKELHKLEEIMSALKQAEEIKQQSGGVRKGVRASEGGGGEHWKISGDNKWSKRGSERL